MQMQGYVYHNSALKMLCENKEKLEITDDLALQILWELYPGTRYGEWKTRDLANVGDDQVLALRCLKYDSQKRQLCHLIEELAWYLMPTWAWTGPSKARLTCTPHLRGLLSRLSQPLTADERRARERAEQDAERDRVRAAYAERNERFARESAQKKMDSLKMDQKQHDREQKRWQKQRDREQKRWQERDSNRDYSKMDQKQRDREQKRWQKMDSNRDYSPDSAERAAYTQPMPDRESSSLDRARDFYRKHRWDDDEELTFKEFLERYKEFRPWEKGT